MILNSLMNIKKKRKKCTELGSIYFCKFIFKLQVKIFAVQQHPTSEMSTILWFPL